MPPAEAVDLSARSPLQAAKQQHLSKLADRLRQGQPLNEPDEMLGETVLEAYGDRLQGLTATTAAKLFKLAVQAEGDIETADIVDAVSDPTFPVRRGRFRLTNGETVDLSQDEANEGKDDIQVAYYDRGNVNRKYGEVRTGVGILSGVLGGLSGGPRGRSGTSPHQNTNDDESDSKPNLPARRPDRNTETSTPEPPESDNRPTPPKNAPIKLDDDLEMPVADKSGKANRKMPGRIYNAIEEKGRAKLGGVLEKGTITTDGSGDSVVNVDVDLPAEAAKKLIEDVASEHNDVPRPDNKGNPSFTGPDGTVWTERPRKSEQGQAGAEVRVQVPSEKSDAGPRGKSMKMTFDKPTPGGGPENER